MINSSLLFVFNVPNVPNGAQLRVFGTFDAPLFVEVDIKKMLDRENINTHLDDYMLGPVLKVETHGKSGGESTITRTVTEAGLNHIVSRSNKPIARIIHKWLLQDILPAIHRHGHHMLPLPPPGGIILPRNDGDTNMLEENKKLVAEKEQLLKEKEQLEAKIKDSQEIQDAIHKLQQAKETEQEATTKIQEAERAIMCTKTNADRALNLIKTEKRELLKKHNQIFDTNVSIKRKAEKDIEELEDKLDDWIKRIKTSQPPLSPPPPLLRPSSS